MIERGGKWGEIKLFCFVLRNKNQNNAEQSITRTFAPYRIKTILTYVKLITYTLFILNGRTLRSFAKQIHKSECSLYRSINNCTNMHCNIYANR